MIKIVADNKIPYLNGALDGVAELLLLPAEDIDREQLLDARAVIVRTRTKCNEKLLKGTSVRFISSATIGFDHIDTEYCDMQGIAWANAPGCNSASVRQYISSALSEIIRMEGRSFREITIGIIGSGNVGSTIESMARLLGINTLVNDPPREKAEGAGKFSSLEHVLEESDIVTMHVPLTRSGDDQTFHMANRDFFRQMKRGSWFINTSRGEVADSKSLIRELKSGHLAGAVIDVWESEPEISRDLLQLAHIATPHIAGYSADGKANGTAMAVRAISRFFKMGMDEWYPAYIPEAAISDVHISCKGKTNEQIFCEVSSFAYNILEDSGKLKKAPSNFEWQRDHYPVRREPGSLKVCLDCDQSPVKELLRQLGYKTCLLTQEL